MKYSITMEVDEHLFCFLDVLELQLFFLQHVDNTLRADDKLDI
jgi:hypothetical protein